MEDPFTFAIMLIVLPFALAVFIVAVLIFSPVIVPMLIIERLRRGRQG